MIKRKKNSGKTGGLFSTKGQPSSRKKSGSTYNLELLESRVLLSADLAGAVQVMPIKPTQAPAQAVVLNVPAGQAATQQTFSVAEMLARPASSFPQRAGEPSQTTSNVAGHAPDSVLSEGSKTPAQTGSEILSESRKAGHQFSIKQSGLASHPVTPTVQSQPSTTQGAASVAIDVNASSLQPAPIPQMQNQPTPMAAPAMQSDMATMPPTVRSQSPLTVSQALVQPTQPVTLSPTEQIVAPQVISLPASSDGTSLASPVQVPSAPQMPPDLTPTVNPVSQEPIPSVSKTVLLSSLIHADGADGLLSLPTPVSTIQTIPQPIVTTPSGVVAVPVTEVSTLPASQIVVQPASSTPQLAADGLPLITPVLPMQDQPVPQPIATSPSGVVAAPVSEAPTLPASQIVVQPASSTPQLAADGLPLPTPVSPIQDQPIAQPISTSPSGVIATPVSEAPTPETSTVVQPVSSTPQLSNDPTGSQTISQSLVTPVQTVSTSPVVTVQTLPATEIVTQPVLSTPQSSVEPLPVVSQPIVAIPPTTTTAPITTLTNSGTATSTAIDPQLPQATVDTSMPTTSVTVRVGPHGDYTDLQVALDNVSLGTTILLEPGVSYTSPNSSGFILPNKTTGTGWIVIRPDMPDSALPVAGTRLTPADSAMMSKILRGAVNNYAISVAPGAHNYRIIGVEFMNQGNMDTPYNGAFLNLDGMESSVSAQSNHIILDRIYIHGPSAPGSVGVKFGVVLGGQYQAVINSTIQDLHSSDGEAKAIAGWNGAGSWLITNNFLSASGENIMIGGATPIISGLTPSNIEITNNHFYKPLAWRDDPAFTSGPNAVVTKNLLELKNAQRVLIDANVFENVWPDAQSGFAVVVTPRGGGSTGSDPWTTVSDIMISNNTFLHVANGLAISGGGPTISLDQGGPTQRGAHFLIENNVFIGLGGDYDANYSSGNLLTIGMGPSDLQIKHNTIVSYAGTGSRGTTLNFTYGISDEGALFPLNHFVLQDNIFAARNNPMKLGEAANLDILMPGYIWTNNVFAGPWPTITGWTAAMMPQGNGNAYPTSLANVGYVNVAVGDYSLSSISPYRGAASDGTDIGVDWNQFNVANS